MPKTFLPTLIPTLKTAGLLLWNKGFAILVLVFLVFRWFQLQNGSTPFSEFFYAGILISGAIIVAPVVRLLVFPEAAQYAESGKLRSDIGMDPKGESIVSFQGKLTPGLIHYWFATGVSFAVTVAGAVALQ